MKKLLLALLAVASLSAFATPSLTPRALIIEVVGLGDATLFRAAGSIRDGGSLPFSDLRAITVDHGAQRPPIAAEVGTVCVVSDARFLANTLHASFHCAHLRLDEAASPPSVERWELKTRAHVPLNKRYLLGRGELRGYGPVAIRVYAGRESVAHAAGRATAHCGRPPLSVTCPSN